MPPSKHIMCLWKPSIGLLLMCALLANLCTTVLYYNALVKERDANELSIHTHHCSQQINSILWTDRVSVIIREFEDFDNNLFHTVQSLLEYNYYNVSILVISDQVPYPPLHLPNSSKIHSVVLHDFPNSPRLHLESFVKSPYVVLLPDGLTPMRNNTLEYMISYLEKQPSDVHLAAWPAERSGVRCLDMEFLVKEWTLKYAVSGSQSVCSALDGESFALIMRSNDLFLLSEPLIQPLHHSLFIQTSLKGWKVSLDLTVNLFQAEDSLFSNPHNQWKHKTNQHAKLKHLYQQFGIKLVQRPDHQKAWFGCNKDTSRCFASIVNDMPDYLYRGRWTPPCCLRAMRITARHVLRILESQGVRYWLEGGSLLGAAREGDIIPWDYDVDIGIYRDDIKLSQHLISALAEPYVDDDGFVWEKAAEGDFIRVQYSASNHIHVDIFPFYSQDGLMTKDTWMKSHRQDSEFPESFLKPLEKLPFVGTLAFVPNNWRTFLELKFGTNVIENPRYPDSSDPH